ncbi:hypothetical protein [Kordia sp.]|uniref:hypothetical protein n=1 Tax=Kordia sp. TaxID=1965332 RepID=UPI003D2B01BD
MKKLVCISALVFGLSFFNSCTPNSVEEQEYEEFQATDKGDVTAPGVEDEEDSND